MHVHPVRVRDPLGRYAKGIDARAKKALRAIGQEGVDLARQAAPVGPPRSDYGRRAPLSESLGWGFSGAASVTWGIKSGERYTHARAQETGGRPHIIQGNPDLVFYWEKRGRHMRTPMVNHPGNPATHFLSDSREAMDTAAAEIARRYF